MNPLVEYFNSDFGRRIGEDSWGYLELLGVSKSEQEWDENVEVNRDLAIIYIKDSNNVKSYFVVDVAGFNMENYKASDILT